MLPERPREIDRRQLDALATLECDGFLATQAVATLPPVAKLVLALLVVTTGTLALHRTTMKAL